MDIRNYMTQIEQQLKEQDAIYHNTAVRYGLSDTSLWVLYFISESEEAVTQQELCRQCFFAKQTVNTAIAGLCKNGYAKLEAIPGTRNHKKINLTQAGRELVANTVDKLKHAEQRAYRKLSDEELNLYLDMTMRLTEALREETEKL